MVPVTPPSVEGWVPSRREITNSQCGCHVRGVKEVGGPVLLVACLPSPPSPSGAGTCPPLPLWASWGGDRVLLPGVRGKLAETPEAAPTPAGTVVTDQETPIASASETEHGLQGEPRPQGSRVLVRKGLGQGHLHPGEPLTSPGPCSLH